MQENIIEDAEFEEIDETVEQLEAAVESAENTPEEQKTFTQGEMLSMLKDAVEAGAITQNDFKRMRSEMGIFQSDFGYQSKC